MAVVNAVTGKPFTVGNIKRGKKKRTAAPPFITSTLQQEASRKLEYDAAPYDEHRAGAVRRY